MLFISGPALGHFGRVALVARALRAKIDCDITVVMPSIAKFDTSRFAGEFDIRRVAIGRKDFKFPAPAFAAALDALFAELAPDLVVHDSCPMRWLSTASFPDCPRAMITNGFVTRLGGAETIQARLFRKRRRRIAKERARRGLAPLADAFAMFESADRVLLADPAWLVPQIEHLPDNYVACGAVWWEADGELPESLADATDVLLCSMGSTGAFVDARFAAAVADRFACIDIVRVHAGTREERVRPVGSHRVFEYGVLPLGKLMPQAAAIMSQGGAGSTLQALAAGKPLLVVPSHRNHRILGELLERRNVAVLVESKRDLRRLTPERVAQISATAAEQGPLHVVNTGAETMAGHLVELLGR